MNLRVNLNVFSRAKHAGLSWIDPIIQQVLELVDGLDFWKRTGIMVSGSTSFIQPSSTHGNPTERPDFSAAATAPALARGLTSVLHHVGNKIFRLPSL